MCFCITDFDDYRFGKYTEDQRIEDQYMGCLLLSGVNHCIDTLIVVWMI